ncbi:MAG: TM0106 family RecB-like putative nuclease [Pseudorhodoplanes sp.]|nr:TM0106 family RecB-like putative nuclease [Pseudorhodoplanes sp.]
MPTAITASMLYDLVMCPHRVTMDINGDPAQRDEPNPFVKMLWERGSLYEREVIAGLDVPFLDLSGYAGDEKERLTLEAMQRGEPLIYSGRIQQDDLLGDPDLLRKEVGGYVAGDIKSGAGEEGPEDNSSPKEHYAVQLGLYTEILERKGLSAGRRAFVWDIHGEEVPYDFTALYGVRNPRTLWQDYEGCIAEARAIIADPKRTRAAYSSTCKFCYWYSACIENLVATDDLTLIPELGRPKRDAMLTHLQSVAELAGCNPDGFINGKKTAFHGIGPDTLKKFHTRARLLSAKDAKPVLHTAVQLPGDDLELFFDIEVDPMRSICYLHGFVERRARDNTSERFVAFFAPACTPDAERAAFADALGYIRQSRPCAIYYYSKYERTIYRKLREKYPDVCSAEEIEELFDPGHAIDLYTDVVRRATEWPTWDFSIKTLAKYLGFSWRDTHPSGAASIEWFDRWIKTGDPAVRQRILDYNEDDCRATRVLLDGIRALG